VLWEGLVIDRMASLLQPLGACLQKQMKKVSTRGRAHAAQYADRSGA
jgi:hypothetical protein